MNILITVLLIITPCRYVRGYQCYCVTTLFTDVGNSSYFEKYYRNGSSPWFREIKMSHLAFVSINHMTSGLKANLSRYNCVFTTECEYGDGLQTEEHIFWDCNLYEDQRATVMDILIQNSKK
jgi:hypothetical protein